MRIFVLETEAGEIVKLKNSRNTQRKRVIESGKE